MEFGSYTAHQRIASGGVADLYMASGPGGLIVAVRALRPEHLGSRIHLRQFEQGVKVLSKLSHPNIPFFLGHGLQNDRVPYVAMEYVQAQNIRVALNKDKNLLWQYHLSIAMQMASALSHLHDRGYLHMDFKPENVLVQLDGSVKIIDFDLSVERPSQATRLPFSGTAVYMAPEILLQEPSDERADIFAFGLTLFEMVAHKKAFGSGTPAQMVQRAKAGYFNTPPSARDSNLKISLGLDRVIRNCLARKIENRYPSMSLVIRDLQQLGEK